MSAQEKYESLAAASGLLSLKDTVGSGWNDVGNHTFVRNVGCVLPDGAELRVVCREYSELADVE